MALHDDLPLHRAYSVLFGEHELEETETIAYHTLSNYDVGLSRMKCASPSVPTHGSRAGRDVKAA